MGMTRGRLVWLLVLASSLLGGCVKQVSLTFLNLTGDTLSVYVTTPQEGRKEVGMVAPMGTLEYDLLIPTEQLPATCSWQAGSYSQSLPVTKGTFDQEINTAAAIKITSTLFIFTTSYSNRRKRRQNLTHKCYPLPSFKQMGNKKF